jgi:broad specificity phosphatase PhoE
MVDFLVRVALAWAAAARVRAGLDGPLLVVSHGLLIRAALQHHALQAEPGLAPAAPVRVRMANTSLSAVDATAPFALRLFNCTAHLAGVADDDGQSLSGG